jgi:hypothetical protein
MIPLGRGLYILADGNKWVPWEGTSGPGYAGVTLFDDQGRAIQSINDSTVQRSLQNAQNLGVSAVNFLLSPTSATDTRLSTFVDGTIDGVVSDPTSGGRYKAVHTRISGFNGTTWDRIRSFAGNADTLTPPTLGLLGVAAFGRVFDGTNYNRIYSLASNTDTQGAAQVGLAGVVNRNQIFNGTEWDRMRSASAANISATTQVPLMVAAPGDWTLISAPAVGVVASATRAAGATGVRHVLTSICADVNCVGAVAAPLSVVVRNGATGVGTILWQRRLTGLAGTTAQVEMSGLNIVGSAATAMTVEFTAAPAGTDFETISATGHSVV